MAQRKQYADAGYYEKKLFRVMERLNIGEQFSYNFDRFGAWVEFRYKGKLYRFDHTVDKAKTMGQTLLYGSDAFAQIILALEDLTRIIERGIYDLQTWVEGMKFLPDVEKLPKWAKALGFESMPSRAEDVKARFRTLSKQYHPDAGGNTDDFEILKNASEQGLRHFMNQK